jgi:hypothetical protein
LASPRPEFDGRSRGEARAGAVKADRGRVFFGRDRAAPDDAVCQSGTGCSASTWRHNLVEISGVEFAQRGEFRPGADEQLAGSVIGGFGLPQRLQVSIDTHERHAEHFAELGLSERQRARVGVCEPGEFGSMKLLAEEMSDPCRLVL